MHASGAGGNCGHHKLLPKTCEPADLRACRNQQNECPKPTHVLLSIRSLQLEKLWGLTTGIKLSDFPAKFCSKLGMSAALTLTVCTLFSCGFLASVDQLTLLACIAKKAPMSISPEATASRPVPVATTGLLGFRLLLWPLPFFDPGVLPLLLLSRPLLLL